VARISEEMNNTKDEEEREEEEEEGERILPTLALRKFSFLFIN